MRYSILYLDDDPSMLRLFAETFGEEYDVRTAATPDEAFAMLDGSAPDLVVSDQQMPLMEGTDFLRRVKERNPVVLRMLLTGQVTVSNKLLEISSGIVQFFLTKPWTYPTMKGAIERALSTLNSGR